MRTTTNNQSSNQLAATTTTTPANMNVNNKRSFSLPSKKSYDFERFANMSLSLAEESNAAAATTVSGGIGGIGSQSSSQMAGKPSNKITVSLTTPAISSSSPIAQLTNAQSINAHLLTSTPSTTSTTLNDPQAGDSNFNVDDLDDTDAKLANNNNRTTSQQVSKNEIAKSSPEFQQGQCLKS